MSVVFFIHLFHIENCDGPLVNRRAFLTQLFSNNFFNNCSFIAQYHTATAVALLYLKKPTVSPEDCVYIYMYLN